MLGRNSRATFSSGRLSDYLSERAKKAGQRIEQETENYILNVNESEYAQFLFEASKIEPLVVDFEGISVVMQA